MPADRGRAVPRRRFLVMAGGAFIAALLQACRQAVNPPQPNGGTPEAGAGSAAPAPQVLAPTPACGEQHEATPAQTEGPYFTPNSPERNNLRPGAGGGTPMVLTGAVLRTDCTPVSRALVDVWHANAEGEYDNEGYRLRGHLFTDDQGSYRLETIVPGLYPGRTRHLHVKVQAPGGRVLTTQLYFPDEPGNRSDGLFSPELNMAVTRAGGSLDASFNFVLDA